MMNTKQKILIVDDSEINREILTAMLEEEYGILKAENGAQAVSMLHEKAEDISLILLDIRMPEMDGFEVLAYMNKYHWIEDIPVIIISAEDSPSYIERAYEFGVVDYIGRPFNMNVVRHRVANTLLLYAKQRRLIGIVTDQIYEKEKSNQLMISILSHIVEFRNGESGLHVLHISTITELLLKQLTQKTNAYPLSSAEINLISTASALHDIGKISIASEILNKPGRLTDEEFEVIKSHSLVGADMLHELPVQQQEEALVKVAYEICRWHHERYDGSGYPDGLKGDEIPISAQVVALADVYDALTSERCYKKAHPHEQAVKMILDGQCGVFNPLLLDCLLEVSESLKKELKINSKPEYSTREIQNMTAQLRDYNLSGSERILQLLECERQRIRFLTENAAEITFNYSAVPPLLSLNECASRQLGLEETILEPLQNSSLLENIENGSFEPLIKKIKAATPSSPDFQIELRLKIRGNLCRCRIICKTIWGSETDEKYLGIIGKVLNLEADALKE